MNTLTPAMPANETHADCLRIITRAEIRMANEVDAARERGDLSKGGSDNDPSRSSGGVGIDSRRLSEWDAAEAARIRADLQRRIRLVTEAA